MKTVISAAVIGGLLLTATSFTAEAARKKCDAGSFWNAAQRACVVAGSRAKPQRMCMSFTLDGSPTDVPCTSL